MNSNEFRHLPEWELIRAALLEQFVETIDSALAATSIQDKEYHRGYAEAIKDFILLPENILPKPNDEDVDVADLTKEDSLGHLYLANRPNKELY